MKFILKEMRIFDFSKKINFTYVFVLSYYKFKKLSKSKNILPEFGSGNMRLNELKKIIFL
tara:strand:- start:154 stop:333 length:180 start_codon:yes stop_codon:yes gene_type:complete